MAAVLTVLLLRVQEHCVHVRGSLLRGLRGRGHVITHRDKETGDKQP